MSNSSLLGGIIFVTMKSFSVFMIGIVILTLLCALVAADDDLGYIVELKTPPLAEKNSGVLSLSKTSQNSQIASDHANLESWFNEKTERKLAKASMPSPNIAATTKIVFNGALVRGLSQAQIDDLKAQPFVKSIVPNKKVQLIKPLDNSSSSVVNNITYENITFTGKGVTLAIIDTGIDYTHPDLGNCTRDQFLSGTCSRIIGGYDFVNDDPDPQDDHFHGTHVAGIAGGNGTLVGIAPQVSLVAYKVLNSGGSGEEFIIIQAIERATDPNQDGNTEDHLNIISLSLGGPGASPFDPMSTAIDNAVDAGVVAVIAAGNSGPFLESIGTPASSRKAITVGASCMPSQVGEDGYCTDPTYKEIAEFSSRGPIENYHKPDILAPGVSICSAESSFASESVAACVDGKHVRASGTSMATPYVSGSVALYLEKSPGTTPEQVKHILENTARNLNYPIYHQGYGIVNITRLLANTVTPPSAYIESVSADPIFYNIVGSASGTGFKSFNFTFFNAREQPVTLGALDVIRVSNGIAPISSGLLAQIKKSAIKTNNISRVTLTTYSQTSQSTDIYAIGSVVSPDGFEPDNTVEDAKVIVPDINQTRSIHTATDKDYVTFNTTFGKRYTLRAFNVSSGLFIGVSPIREAKALSHFTSASYSFIATQNRTEVASVESLQGVGTYELSLTEKSVANPSSDQYEPDNSLLTAKPIALQQTQIHTLPLNITTNGITSDEDYFSFIAQADTEYFVGINTTSDFIILDAYDSNKDRIRIDQEQFGLNHIYSFISFDPGTYYLKVEGTTFEPVSYNITLSTVGKQINRARYNLTTTKEKILQNNEFTVDVTLKSQAQIFAAEFALYFDTDAFQFISVTEGNYLKQGGVSTFPVIGTNSSDKGRIQFAATRVGTQTGATGQGTLATLKFKALNSSSSKFGGYLFLDEFTTSSSNGTEIESFGNDELQIEISSLPSDIDGSCKVDIFDLAFVGKQFGKTQFEPDFDRRADLNDDRRINIFDLALVGRNFGIRCDSYELNTQSLLQLQSTQVQAVGDNIFAVLPPAIIIDPQNTTTIYVNLSMSNQTFAGQAVLQYNPAVLDVLSVTEGDFFKKNGAQTFHQSQINSTNGTVSFQTTMLGSGATGATGQGSFVVLTFQGKARGVTPLTLSSVQALANDAATSLMLHQINNATVTVGTTNRVPQIISQPLTQINSGQNYSYDVEATDLDGDTLTYAINQSPLGMTIDSITGLIRWTPRTQDVGTAQVRVLVSDPQITVAQSFNITVTQGVNNNPTFTSSPPTTVGLNQTYTYDADATDSDGDPLVFSLTLFPQGMVINNATGLVQWTPTQNQLGNNSVSIRVADNRSGTADQNFSIRVLQSQNTPPLITSTPQTIASPGASYGYTVIAQDADGERLTFTLTTAPSGMSINSISGQILWTPSQSQVGSHSVLVRVEDPRGGFATQSFTILVQPAGPFRAQPATLEFGNATAERNQISLKSFKLFNDQNISIVLNITDSISNAYQVGYAEAENGPFTDSLQTSINSNSTKDIFVRFFIPLNQQSKRVDVGDILIRSGPNSATVDTFVTTVSKLSFNRIKLRSDGSSDTVNDGGTADEIKAGQELEVEVEVENLFPRATSIDFDDVELEITIEDLDGRDESEDVPDFSLDAGEEEKHTLSIAIPIEAEDRKHRMLITAQGRDENGAVHSRESTVFIDLERERHDIRITQFEANKESISCDRSIDLFARVFNAGRSKEREASLEFVSAPLGIAYTEGDFELEEDPDDSDSEVSVTKNFRISNAVAPGSYQIVANSYYDSTKLSDSASLTLQVRNCEEVEEELIDDEGEATDSSDDSVVVVYTKGPTGGSSTLNPGRSTVTPPSNIRVVDTDSPVLLLALLVVLTTGLCMLAAGYLVVNGLK